MLTPHVDDRIAHTVLSLDAHVYVFTMVNANESQNKGKESSTFHLYTLLFSTYGFICQNSSHVVAPLVLSTSRPPGEEAGVSVQMSLYVLAVNSMV